MTVGSRDLPVKKSPAKKDFIMKPIVSDALWERIEPLLPPNLRVDFVFLVANRLTGERY